MYRDNFLHVDTLRFGQLFFWVLSTKRSTKAPTWNVLFFISSNKRVKARMRYIRSTRSLEGKQHPTQRGWAQLEEQRKEKSRSLRKDVVEPEIDVDPACAHTIGRRRRRNTYGSARTRECGHWKWCEAQVSHWYISTLEGPHTPEENLDEINLPKLSSIFSNREYLDAWLETFGGPGRLAQLEI
jgi:hypothetical protein